MRMVKNSIFSLDAIDRTILRWGSLLLLVLLAYALRIAGLTAQSLWRDEVDALLFSQAPLTSLAYSFTRPGWNGPLYYVFLRLWVALAGSDAFALRYLSLLAGVLGVAILYRLARAWLSPWIGGVAALLLACAPYMVWYAQEAKMYALLVAVATGTLYLYYRACQGADWRIWIVIVLLIWTTAGIHVMGALLLPVMALLLPLWWPLARDRWRQALLTLAAGALPGLVAWPWAWPWLVRGGNIGHRFTPLPGMLTTMLYAFGRGITATGQFVPIGLTLLSLLAGTVLWSSGDLIGLLTVVRGRRVLVRRVGEATHVCAAWIWLLVPVLGLYAISTRVPMFVDRYLIWIGPAFYMLMARGLDQIRRRSSLLAGLCLAAIVALNGAAIWAQSATPLKSDFRAAAAYLRQHRQPGELVMFHISYVRATFETYYGDASPAADGVPTDEQTTPETVDATIRARIADHQVVWLVLSEPEMWDQRGMTRAWLEEHAEPDMQADFARVSVIRYRMSPSD
jgi:uncharacterized membrane protein